MKLNSVLSGLLVACIATIFAGPAQAQQERDVIELIKSQLSTSRQALVAENMSLTAEESEIFWPLYRNFKRSADR